MSEQKETKLNPMDGVDFEKQERELLSRAAAFRAKHERADNKLGVVNEVVNIYSDGVRLSATIWRPTSFNTTSASGDKLPAILLCHGWGGKRGHLDFSYAPRFAASGFVAVTFDYRGWGDSDGVTFVSTDKKGVAQSVTVRKVIDPEWQLRDIDSALWYVHGLDYVDRRRVGIWGSSLGGGHVLATCARRRKDISCCVCQIGSINTHANWVNRHPDYRGEEAIEQLAIAQAQGKVFPWTLKNPVGLDGAPHLPKLVFEHTQNNTLASLSKIICPTLILAAEKEELFHNEKNSELVYEKLKKENNVPTDLKYLPGGHYDAYNNPAYQQGLSHAIQWFSLYLSAPGAAASKL